jgi:hypothetical protein
MLSISVKNSSMALISIASKLLKLITNWFGNLNAQEMSVKQKKGPAQGLKVVPQHQSATHQTCLLASNQILK